MFFSLYYYHLYGDNICTGNSSTWKYVWTRSQIIPVPSYVYGVSNFKIDISDGWFVKTNPSGNIRIDIASTDGWAKYDNQINRRSRGSTQALRIFKRGIKIPSTFKGKRIIIRFGGVAHEAELYVNARHVRILGFLYGMDSRYSLILLQKGLHLLQYLYQRTKNGACEFCVRERYSPGSNTFAVHRIILYGQTLRLIWTVNTKMRSSG